MGAFRVLLLLYPSVATAALELELNLEPTSITVGQPVRATYTLQNASSSVLTGDLCLPHNCGRLRVEIILGKEARQFVSKSLEYGQSLERVYYRVTLAPGGTVESTECILYDEQNQNFAFPDAGTYQVRAVFGGEAISNLVTVNVSNPGGDNRAALEFVEKHGLQPYLCSEVRYYELTKEQTTDLDALTKRYPSTVYAAGAEEALRILGVRPHLSVPEVLDFGLVPVGQSVAQDFGLSNSGEQSLYVTAVTALEEPFGAEVPRLPAEVAGKESITIPVQFTPAGPYTEQALWRIEAGTQVAFVELRGEGSVASRLELAPSSIDFGRIPPGTVGQKSLILNNVGKESLVIDSLSQISSPFSYVNRPSLPLTLAAGESYDLQISFSAEPGIFDGVIVVHSNDSWSPEALVRVTGGGATEGCGCSLGSPPRSHNAAVLLMLLCLALAPCRSR